MPNNITSCPLETRIESLRERLVDLSRKNPLLHFKMSDKNPHHIEFFFPSHELFNKIQEKRALVLACLEAEQKELVKHVDPLAEHSHSTVLKTKLPLAELEARVQKISKRAKEAKSEKGISVSRCVLGFLQWYDDRSDEPTLSPLLIAPIELTLNKKAKAACRFSVSATSEEEKVWIVNPALRLKLEVDHHICLPEVFTNTEMALEQFFHAVQEVISLQPTWSISRRSVITNLGFSRLAIYEDIALKNWRTSESGTPSLMMRLLMEKKKGDSSAFSDKDESSTRELQVLPSLIFDADGSQIDAIRAVLQGKSIVIEGPPGTGKSQTISNIIGACLSQGKSILFVTEKSAAIDIVLQRLKSVKLSHFCLNLHQGAAKRTSTYDQIKTRREFPQEEFQNTVALQTETYTNRLAEITKLTEELEAHANMLAARAEGQEASVAELIWRANKNHHFYESLPANLRQIAIPPILSSIEKKRISTLLDKLESSLQENQNTFTTREKTALLQNVICAFKEKALFIDLIKKAKEPIAKLRRIVDIFFNDFSDIFTLKHFQALSVVFSQIRALSKGAQNAALKGFLQKEISAESLQKLADREEKVYLEHEKAKCFFYRSLLDEPLAVAKHAQEILDAPFFRKFTKKYRIAWAAFYQCTNKEGKKLKRSALCKHLCSLNDYHKELVSINAENNALGISSGLSAKAVREAVLAKHDLYEVVSIWYSLLEKKESSEIDNSKKTTYEWLALFIKEQDEMLSAMTAATEVHSALCDIIRLKMTIPSLWQHNDQEPAPIITLANHFNALDELAPQIGAWIDFQEQRYSIIQEFPWLSPLIDYALENPSTSTLAHVFEVLSNQAATTSIAPRITKTRSAIETCTSLFKNHELSLIKEGAAWVTRHLLSREIPIGISWGPKRDWTELSLILNELQKSSRRCSTAKLMERSLNAIQALMPCFMMSPSSVAECLSFQRKACFDLVIIDEASQLKVEESLSALFRGKQLVVVGDQKQMPPSSLFGVDHLEDSVADEDAEDYESILDLAKTAWPAYMLKWHYRSQHESLITFSNQHFYDNKLIIAPTGTKAACRYGGVRVISVLGTYKKGENDQEAQGVLNEAIALMETSPELSLGIIALNRKQQELIEKHLDSASQKNSAISCYQKKWENTHQPLLIKNLENVQGDERDIIIISTVYGPEKAHGEVCQRFGPINTKHGHRRLNVLFTRARIGMIVVTSLKAEDIKLDPAKPSLGKDALNKFLTYAKTGQYAVSAGNEQPENDFEECVGRFLSEQGYQVFYQVGQSGFRVDIGVKHPLHPDGYIAGIECDGYRFHSSKSARDNDRLRQTILEANGWRIYRVLSGEWYHNRQGAESALNHFLENILRTL